MNNCKNSEKQTNLEKSKISNFKMFLDFNFQIEKNEKIRKNIRRISGAYENKLKRC